MFQCLLSRKWCLFLSLWTNAQYKSAPRRTSGKTFFELESTSPQVFYFYFIRNILNPTDLEQHPCLGVAEANQTIAIPLLQTPRAIKESDWAMFGVLRTRPPGSCFPHHHCTRRLLVCPCHGVFASSGVQSDKWLEKEQPILMQLLVTPIPSHGTRVMGHESSRIILPMLF